MGQLVTTALGAIGGFLIGGPFGAQIGAMIGGAIGSELFGPTIEGPRLNDLTVSSSTYGNAIPRLFGTSRMSTNMIWTSGIKEKKEKKRAGKGGPKQTVYTYSASFAVAICAGPLDGVLRIWADGKLIAGSTDPITNIGSYNGFLPADLVLSIVTGKKKNKYKYTFYNGSETQLPSPVMEAKEGVGNVPAHRGLAYIVFENMPLEDFGNRIPQITVEVTKAPVSQVPYMHIQNNDDSYVTSGTPFIDYDTDRWIMIDGATVKVFSLSTNQLIDTFPINIDHGSKMAMGPGGGPFIYQIGSSNNRPYAKISGTAFGDPSVIRGRSGNFFDEYPVRRCCGSDDDPVWMANGQNIVIRVFNKGSPEWYFVNASPFGGGSVYSADSFKFVNFVPPNGTQVRLGEFDGYSQFGQWWTVTGGCHIDTWTIRAGAQAKNFVQTPVSPSECDCEYKYIFSPDDARCYQDGSTDITLDASLTSIDEVYYDPSDNSVVIVYWRSTGTGNKPCCAKYMLDEGVFKFNAKDLPGVEFGPGGGRARQTRLNGGSLSWAGSFPPKAYSIDLQNGNVIRSMGISGTGFNSFGWDDVSQTLFASYYSQGGTGGSGTGFCRIAFARTSGTVSVGSIAAEIMDDTGQLLPTDYDVSQLDSIPVIGYIISRESTARDCLQQLASTYLFDGVESDYKLKFVLRGGSPVATITENQMANVEDRDTQLKETLAQETEAPMRVTVNYMDKERDYQTGSQFAKRITNPYPTMNSRLEAKVDLPIVLLATDAKKLADKTLKMLWTNRTMGEASLPWKFLKHDPTDVVTITLNDGSSRDVRFSRIDTGADMTLKVSTVSESQTAYTSDVEAESGRGGVPPQQATDFPPATPEIINTPLLRDVDDTEGAGTITYISAYSISTLFGGAYVSVQSASNEDFEEVTFIDDSPICGTAKTALPATRSWASTDTTTELIVSLYSKDWDLTSITYDQLMAGYNLALVGNEVIQFKDADLNDDGTWTLTNILRARRGTDPWVMKHTAGERFVMLSTNGSIQPSTRTNVNFNVTAKYKATPPGRSEETSFAKPVTLNPNDLRPYSVTNVKVIDDDTTVTISATRRSRLTWEMKDLVTIAPNEEGSSGLYTFTIWAGMDLLAAMSHYENEGIKSLDDSGVLDSLTSIIENANVFTPGDTSGIPLDPELEIEMSTTMEEFVCRIVQTGYAKGFPTYFHAKRGAEGDPWDITELY